MQGENARMACTIRDNVRELGEGWQYAIGGDYNMLAEELQRSGLDADIGATITVPDTKRGTCRTRSAGRTIDYFLLSAGLARVLRGVAAVEASGVKTHTPVQLELAAGAVAFRGLYLRLPPRLANERVYGPTLPQQEWSHVLAMAINSAEVAAQHGAALAAPLIDRAYAVWAVVAEQELQDVTGCYLRKAGTRAQRPRLVWRSILGDAKQDFSGSYPEAAVLFGSGRRWRTW